MEEGVYDFLIYCKERYFKTHLCRMQFLKKMFSYFANLFDILWAEKNPDVQLLFLHKIYSLTLMLGTKHQHHLTLKVKF